MGWFRKGAGLLLCAVVLAFAQVAGAFSYYAPGPQGTIGLSRPTISQQLQLDPGERITRAQLWLDGVKVEPVWDENGLVQYTPPAPLAPGAHRVRLVIEVAAARAGWSYDPLIREFTFVVGAGALAELPAPGPEERTALAHVNAIRRAAGLDELTLANDLSIAALSHARYLAANPEQQQLDAHGERAGTPLFTGRRASDRAAYWGYRGGISEVVNWVDRAEDAIDGWMDTLYHRIPLIHPGNRSMGYGRAGSGENLVNVLKASPADETPGEVLWPYPGQTGVPTGWDGAEVPDPFRLYPGARRPVGYTITLTFGGRVRSLRLQTGSLTGPGGELKVMRFDPSNDDELDDTVALIPTAPLEPGTTYSAYLSGQVDLGTGLKPFEKRWSFTTAAAPLPQVDRRLLRYRSDGTVTGIVLEGTGFTRDMRIFLGGLPVADFQVESAGRVSLEPPAGFTGGPADLLLVTSHGREWVWRSFLTGRESQRFGGVDSAFERVSLTINGKRLQTDGLVHLSGRLLLPESALAAMGARREDVTGAARTYWSLGARTGDYTVGRVAAGVNGTALLLALPPLRVGADTYVDAAFVEGLTGSKVVRSDAGVALNAGPEGLADIAGHWARDQILQLVRSGIVSGHPDGTFRPDDTLTRAAFVKMLVGARSLALRPGAAGGYTDTAGHWSVTQGYLGAAVEAGIIVPGEYPGRRFEPERPITREEIAVMVVRALGLEVEAVARRLTLIDGRATIAGRLFTDAAQWGRSGHIAVAVERGVITGYQEEGAAYTYRPARSATRAEAAVITVRAISQ